MDTALENFKQTDAGKFIAAQFTHDGFVAVMKGFSEHGEAAAKHIGKRLADKEFVLSDTEKMTTGRWVREVMEENGWTVTDTEASIGPGCTFKTGQIYQKRQKP